MQQQAGEQPPRLPRLQHCDQYSMAFQQLSSALRFKEGRLMCKQRSESCMAEVRIECVRAAAHGNGCQVENRLQSLQC